MSIRLGPLANVYESNSKGGGADADHIGITTRISPIVDPNNISIRGTGRRGLYNVLLGMIEPRITFDLFLNDKTFLTTYQSGQNAINYLHLKTGNIGITYTKVYLNRVTVISRHNEAFQVTVEAWAESGESLTTQDWGDPSVTPYRWLDTSFAMDTGSGSEVESQWWEWRYEINNNLQRLGDVDSGGTREIVAKARTVTGSLVKDLRSWDEFIDMMDTSSEEGLVGFRIKLDTTTIINSDGRWDVIEAPIAAEDLIAKRFPFTLLDES